MEGKKSNKLGTCIGVIALIILGYVLFITLYNQIIAQNEGFFYIFVFGGILVLVLVLLSLITKLIAISPAEGSGLIWNIFEAIGLIAISTGFMFVRLRFVSSLPVEETLFYKTANFMVDNTLTDSLDVVNKLLRSPIDYTYGKLLGFVFKITGVEPRYVVFFNAAIIILTAFFAYRCVRHVGGRLIGLLTFIATLFIPSQSYAVYSYNSEYIFALFIFMSLDIYLALYITEDMNKVMRIVMDVFLGMSVAILLITEPVSLIFILLIILHAIIFRTGNTKGINVLTVLISFLIAFAILFFIKTNTLGVEYSDLTSSIFTRFDPSTNHETGTSYGMDEIYKEFSADISDQTKCIVDNYYFLTRADGRGISAMQASWLSLGTNLLYMFMLVLSIGCVFFMIRVGDQRLIPFLMLLAGTLIAAFLKSTRDYNSFYFFEIIIVIGCLGLRYMYENHHPEAVSNIDTAALLSSRSNPEPAEEEEELSEEEMEMRLKRAKALIFIGENDTLYKAIKAEEAANKKERPKEDKSKKTVKSGEPLENPLPVPKKHKSKPMEFDDDKDDFDFDYDISDDNPDDFDF